MPKKILFLFITLSNAGLILLALTFGTQNLKQKHSLSLGFSKTPAYPTGFILGASMTLGFISGGCTSALLIPSKKPLNRS